MKKKNTSTNTLKKINDKSIELLRYIYSFKASHPYSPSFREMSKAIEGGHPMSTSVLRYYLRGLRQSGLIDFVPRQARTTWVTKEGKEFLASLQPRRSRSALRTKSAIYEFGVVS